VDVAAATAGYETWLAGYCRPGIVPGDLEFKHDRMADPADPFPFFRGTYYLWARHWPAVCPGPSGAPRVAAVGDLHVENFGTWRDADGRLCWGVNDFDEVDTLAYTNDLVRLAASVRFAKKAGALSAKLGDACGVILAGYRECLESGHGRPFVLEEHHPVLRGLAMSAEREPARFWDKLTKLLADPEPDVPADARAALLASFPAAPNVYDVRARSQVGMGSLGRPRYVAIAEWCGGLVAREIKTAAPPATAWVNGSAIPPRAAEAVARAVRSPDPYYQPGPAWVVRRIAPRCSRIELASLPGVKDVDRVLHAMGAETANVHLGTPGTAPTILADLHTRPADWLETAARAMADQLEQDWAAWRTAHAAGRPHGKR